MADKVVNIKVDDLEADGASVVGRIIHVYDTYANALSHGNTGLSTIKSVDRLTGAIGSAITQDTTTTPQTGVTVDNNGLAIFAADDNSGAGQEYFWISDSGRQSGPRRIVVQ